MNPVTVQYGGKVNSSERRHASVMEEVPFGLMRSILMALVELPVTDGSSDNFMDGSSDIFIDWVMLG